MSRSHHQRGKEILSLLARKGHTSAELARSLNCSDRQIRRDIEHLPVHQERHGRSIIYTTTCPGQEAGNRESRTSSENTSDSNSGQLGNQKQEIPCNINQNQKLPCNWTTNGYPEQKNAPCRENPPYKFGFLEVDAVQYVIVDEKFRDSILEKAIEENWPSKKSHGLVRIRLPHLTFQVGSKTITIYSDAPDKIANIERWIRETFSKYYGDAIEGLVRKITHPTDLAKAELTINVTDKTAIATILNILGPFPEKNYHYIQSPNHLIPGFKAYLKEGTLRCEFDGGGPVKPFNSIYLQDEFFSILPSVVTGSQRVEQFFKDYYNIPQAVDTDPSNIACEISNMVTTEVKRQLAEMDIQPKRAESRRDSLNEDSAFIKVLQDISLLDSFSIEEIQLIFHKHLNLPAPATDTFLAGFHCWHKKKFRAVVLVEEIIKVLTYQGKMMTAKEIYDMRALLITTGLFRRDPEIEICFSAVGTTIAKKLATKYSD